MKEISKQFNFRDREDGIYSLWEKSGFFNPDKLKLPKNAKSYAIVLPPPNITAKLHLGHSSMLAIEDLLIRYHRMKGYRALWIPGTDHAAIATQNVVEKKLLKEKNITRHDLGKEKFLKEVWNFLQITQARILMQTKKMGSSMDWSREAFTLDEKRKKAVRKMFVDMYNEGVIYQGERIVNWCPRCKSTLADDELEYQEQKAKLYTFKYSDNFPIAIATTRPETKLGDTAVAVNPKDPRYKSLIGKTYEVDFLGKQLEIKIISDRQVDMNFGTGALGVTPAHSAVDWKMAEDNKLKTIKVIDEEGKINSNFGKFSGLSAIQAREKIVEELKKKNLIQKEEEIDNNLSTCYRCNAAIEPIPSKQWFVAVDKKIKRLGNKSLKEKSIEVAKKGKIKFIPFHFTKSYIDWMENLHDWCISRQIWFGHEIPVWYKKSDNKNQKSKTVELNFYFKNVFEAIRNGQKTVETRALNPEENDRFFGSIKRGDRITCNYKENGKIKDSLTVMVLGVKKYKSDKDLLENINIEKILPGKKKKSSLVEFHKSIPGYYEKIEKNGIIAFEIGLEKQEIYVGEKAPKGEGWIQDPDTLDTWFSSGMWTFSTLGWPNNFKNGKKSGDLKKFHPTQVLETGYEIITLWVSRMIMMSLFALGEVPFENVYLHGMVLDQHGKKMSKSKGNGIDPVDVIEKSGTDAVRLSLLIGSTPGNNLRLSEEKIESFRNFITKFWNIYRYCRQSDEEFFLQERIIKKDIKSLSDRWIISRLNDTVSEITKNLDGYKFSLAGETLENFVWNDFANWYLEINKLEKNSKVLGYVFDKILRLWHPFIPFVTEEIWQELTGGKKILMVGKWPVSDKKLVDKKAEKDFENLKNVISKIRSVRSSYHIDPARIIDVSVKKIENPEILEKLARIKINPNVSLGVKGIIIAEKNIKLTLLVSDLIDTTKEKMRFEKEIVALEDNLRRINGLLSNQNFLKSAPEEVILKNKEALSENNDKIKTQKKLLEDLKKFKK